VFVYRPQAHKDQLRNQTLHALARMSHRGPDDQRWIAAPGYMIGHCRLSIIDLNASQQPMTDPAGRYVLAYNGELYNFRELRLTLRKRWQFRTEGDTEVVLAGLVSRGPDFLREMEGMCALVLWDRRQKRLLLARDRMGKKPLYYQSQQESFACASELPALASLADAPWTEDLNSTADYFRYGYYLPGTTAYEGVYEVLPGHYMYWSPGKTPQTRAYWKLSIGGFDGTQQEARQQLKQYLLAAIKRRLVADVEVGAFLSGGIDSSLLVGLLTRELNASPKTFTIGFKERSYDERKYAQLIAQHCRTEHYEQCLAGWNVDTLKALILEHIGQPFTDSSLLPTALVSQLAARHVKVALSGDGGDELFSGYQRYQARAILRWYSRLPKHLRLNLERTIRSLPEPMAHHSGNLLKKAHLFLDIVNRQACETPYIAPVMYANADYERLAPELLGRGHVAPNLPEYCDLDDILRMMTADALVYLPQDILVKVDRASMACSLEARAPFLDRRVVELAYSLPRRWHRRGLAGKHMLRESFPDLLPKAIWRRPKQGFGVPIHQWFRETLGAEVKQLIQEPRTPLNQEYVLELLNAHQERRRDHGYRLWQIYIYLLWRNTAICETTNVERQFKAVPRLRDDAINLCAL
jgi:asparagine synthase (glutamine-hydrolysing)